MTTEESAMQADWRSDFQEPNLLTFQQTNTAVSSGLLTARDTETETSVVRLSGVLIIILGGMATTFAVAAIIVSLATYG